MPHPHCGVGQKVIEFVPASASYALTLQYKIHVVSFRSGEKKKCEVKVAEDLVKLIT